MSTTSLTSSKREAQEKTNADLMLELDAARSLNSCLRTLLDHLRLCKKNLAAINENCTHLSKVNDQWIDTLSIMK